MAAWRGSYDCAPASRTQTASAIMPSTHRPHFVSPSRLACALAWLALAIGSAAAQQGSAFVSDAVPAPGGEFIGPPLPHGEGAQPSPSEPLVMVPPRAAPRYVEPWTWQLLPEGLIYRSYLAGAKEPRMGVQWVGEDRWGNFFDATLGARVGLIRYGTTEGWRPQGWELDVEGAAFPRLDMDDEGDVIATDFRIGVPLTYGRGNWEYKLAYYHLSAHAGDELLLRDPTFVRINYSRDAIVWGTGYRPNDDWRFYGEAGWAFHADQCDPWEFQFGIEYSPGRPTDWRGAPFAAVNAHLHEEVDFGGRFTAEAGWQWRGDGARHLLRLGFFYLSGMSPQYEFLPDSEEQVGAGLWYDF